MKLERDKFELLAAIVVVSTAVMVAFGQASSVLGFNASEFYLWQSITAHFVHYDVKHLITNMLALGILLFLFPLSNRDLIKGLVLAVILIDIYLYFSDIRFYIGFSGLLYVIPGGAFVKYILNKKYTNAVLLMLIFLVYILISVSSLNISDGVVWKPLLQAHILGFIAGIITKIRQKTSTNRI